MARLRTNCPTCGVIEVPLERVRLERDRRQGLTTYSVHCIQCDDWRLWVADNHTLAVLLEAGLRPVELQPTATPLTYDDLLDLHAALEQPDWFERFTRQSSHQRH